MDGTRSLVNSYRVSSPFHQIFITLRDLTIQLLLLFLLILNLQTQRSKSRSLVILYRSHVLFGDQGTAVVNCGAF